MHPHLESLVKSDLRRYTGRETVHSFLLTWVRVPGFRFSYYLRKSGFYRSRSELLSKVRCLYNRLMLRHYQFKYGFQISAATQIGAGLYLGHWGGVVISTDAVIGNDVNINHGVTIGVTCRGGKRGAPVIGDRVWIGAHAVVVGKISVGCEALIAPGAYVNFDVPKRAVVIGNPGRIVSYLGSDGYVMNTAPERCNVPPVSGVESFEG